MRGLSGAINYNGGMALLLLRRCCALIAAYAIAMQAILSVLPVLPQYGATASAVFCAGAPGQVPAVPGHAGDNCCLAAGCGDATADLPRPSSAVASGAVARAVISVLHVDNTRIASPGERPRGSRAPPV